MDEPTTLDKEEFHGHRIYDPGKVLSLPGDQVEKDSPEMEPPVMPSGFTEESLPQNFDPSLRSEVWEIDPLLYWGRPLNRAEIASLRHQRTDRGSPVIRKDAKLLAKDGSVIPVPSTLMDTGSTTFDFISPRFARANPNIVIHTLAQPTCVVLGDAKTKKPLSVYVLMPLFFRHNGKEHRGIVQLFLFDSGYDVIIGMPSILRYFPTFICAQILNAAPHISDDDMMELLQMVDRKSVV